MVVPTTRSIPVMALRLRPDRSGGANVEAAWDVTKGNAALSIAVLDTGYVDHGDLSPRIVGGYDLVSRTPGPDQIRDKPAADCTANDGGGRDADAHDPGTDHRGRGRGTTNGGWYGAAAPPTVRGTARTWEGRSAMTNNSIGVAGVN